jgi:FAD-dependent fumarate reductase
MKHGVALRNGAAELYTTLRGILRINRLRPGQSCTRNVQTRDGEVAECQLSRMIQSHGHHVMRMLESVLVLLFLLLAVIVARVRDRGFFLQSGGVIYPDIRIYQFSMPFSKYPFLICLVLLPIFASILYNYLIPFTMSPTMSTAARQHAIIVGSGLAGLSAASELAAYNIPVHILERLPKPGGNSIKASSGINGAPTRFQTINDDQFYPDTLKSVGPVLNHLRDQRESLISTLTESSSSAVNWLVDDKGIDLSRVSQLGGHSKPRTHRGSGKLPPGAAIVTTLLKALQSNPDVHLETSSSVTKVLHSEKEVVGVQYIQDGQTKTLHGPVIFASGGFAGDSTGLLAQYRPDLAGYPSTNEAQPGSTSLLTDAGAQLLDMDQIQVHPTGFVDPEEPSKLTKFLAAEMLRGEGGLLLLDSKRFINELETRKVVTDAIVATPPKDDSPHQWDVTLVLDEGAYNATKSHVDFYIFKGLMRKTTVTEGLGDAAIPALQQFADAAKAKGKDSFGRTEFGSWGLVDVKADSVVYVGRTTPVVHYTMGGVIFNTKAEVLNASGSPIRGLWAAGEATGGIHGSNRLGGSSLLECVVFGRIAGQEVAMSLKN